MELLQPTYMQLQQALLLQINSAIELLQQRPDTLDPFTAWLSDVLPHLLPGVAAAVGCGSSLAQQSAGMLLPWQCSQTD